MWCRREVQVRASALRHVAIGFALAAVAVPSTGSAQFPQPSLRTEPSSDFIASDRIDDFHDQVLRLGADDWFDRQAARRRLKSQYPTTLPALIRGLSDPELEVRLACRELLDDLASQRVAWNEERTVSASVADRLAAFVREVSNSDRDAATPDCSAIDAWLKTDGAALKRSRQLGSQQAILRKLEAPNVVADLHPETRIQFRLRGLWWLTDSTSRAKTVEQQAFSIQLLSLADLYPEGNRVQQAAFESLLMLWVHQQRAPELRCHALRVALAYRQPRLATDLAQRVLHNLASPPWLQASAMLGLSRTDPAAARSAALSRMNDWRPCWPLGQKLARPPCRVRDAALITLYLIGDHSRDELPWPKLVADPQLGVDLQYLNAL